MENKNNGLLIGIIAILVVALLGLSIYVAYNKGIIFNNINDNEIDNDEVENETEQGEVEITNVIIKDKLDELVNKFNKTAFYTVWYEEGYSIYSKDTLSNDSKLLVVLHDLYTTLQFEKAYVTKENGFEIEEAIYTVVDLNIVKEKYKELFNEELLSYSNVGKCPWYSYDKETNKYRAAAECGGTGYDTYISYNNKYTEDENNMYVYVNVGRYASKDIQDANGLTIFGADLYADVTKEKLYKANLTDKNIVIDESNYTDFSEYKYTFSKDSDGRIYYKSIERVR